MIAVPISPGISQGYGSFARAPSDVVRGVVPFSLHISLSLSFGRTSA